MNPQIIYEIEKYLKSKRIVDFEHETNAVFQRRDGKKFTLEEHLRALIYALLSNQRSWNDIEPKLATVDKIFFNYDISRIKKYDGKYFEEKIRNAKCGNRSIKRQMKSLHYNIGILEKIEHRYGTLDSFVTSAEPKKIAQKISNADSEFKLKQIGIPLAMEYLRNVGIDASKPDLHMKRIMGQPRLGVSRRTEATEEEVIREVHSLARKIHRTEFEIDYLLWAYCADGKGDICSAEPKCNRCVIRQYCNKGKNRKDAAEFGTSKKEAQTSNTSNDAEEYYYNTSANDVLPNDGMSMKEAKRVYKRFIKSEKKDKKEREKKSKQVKEKSKARFCFSKLFRRKNSRNNGNKYTENVRKLLSHVVIFLWNFLMWCLSTFFLISALGMFMYPQGEKSILAYIFLVLLGIWLNPLFRNKIVNPKGKMKLSQRILIDVTLFLLYCVF